MKTDSCILQQFGGDCACRPEIACERTAASCFPAPDCPPSVTTSEPNAKCVQPTPAAASDTACVCGCASCAATCDGQGPILGAGTTLRFDMPGALPAGGRVGVMVRLRGRGRVTVRAVTERGPSVPIGDLAAPSEFSDILAGANSGPPPGIALAQDRLPTALELVTDASGGVEIDCVVPYVAP